MTDLSLKTNPFITESQREFWVPIERRVQETYGLPLLVYMENEKRKGYALQNIATKLGVECSKLYGLLRRTGPLEKKSKNITTKTLENTTDLEVKLLPVLEEELQQAYGEQATRKIMSIIQDRQFIDPSSRRLPYSLEKSLFKSYGEQATRKIIHLLQDKQIIDTSPKKIKKITLQVLEDIDDLEIRTVECLNCNPWSLPSYQYWKKIEQELIEQKKAPSLSAYLIYEYHFKLRTLRELASEFGRSHQTIANLMKKLGIPPKYL